MTSSEAGNRWTLGLASWIIQDGNYADMSRGQRVRFAVEFSVEGLELVDARTPSARLTKDSDYQIVGRVVCVYPAAWVVDCGLLVLQGETPPGIEEGDWVTGIATLGVDPFAYPEQLHNLPGMPALIYTWEIESIRRQTAPFVEVAPRRFERDESQWGYTEVDKTDGWNDDDGRASYLLDCRRLDVAPQTSRATGSPG